MRTRISLAALLIIIVGGFLLVGSAYAHAKYERSEPNDGAVITTPPERIDIWFAQELFRRQGENRIQVVGPGDQPVSVSDVQIDNDDRKHVWAMVNSTLTPGLYRVDWNNVSAEDGDPDQGSFSFTYDPAAVVTSLPSITETPTETTLAVTEIPAVSPIPSQVTELQNLPAPTTPETKPASGSGSCLPGMLPIASIAVLLFARRQRRSGGG